MGTRPPRSRPATTNWLAAGSGGVAPLPLGWAYHLWFARNRESPRRLRKVTAWEGVRRVLPPRGNAPCASSQPWGPPLPPPASPREQFYGFLSAAPSGGFLPGGRGARARGGSPVRMARTPPKLEFLPARGGSPGALTALCGVRGPGFSPAQGGGPAPTPLRDRAPDY